MNTFAGLAGGSCSYSCPRCCCVGNHEEDLVSCGAMLQGLANLCPSALPFVRKFYSSPSHYFWEDDAGAVHDVAPGEGATQ